jgi:flagellar export protein FliJ
MAFHFRLEGVRRHRKHVEDTAALDLARAQQRLEATRARLAALHADTQACRQALVSAARQGSTGLELSRLALTVEGLQAESNLCAAELGEQRERVDEAREVLVRAARAHRILQQLEGAARAAYVKRIGVLEQRDTDEVAASGFLARRSQADGEGSR